MLKTNHYLNREKQIFILETKIKIKTPVFIYPNPYVIIKLIRNTFTEKEIILDDKNEQINFNYLRKLNELQEKGRLHLCNKISKRHINFFKQKVKVKLIT